MEGASPEELFAQAQAASRNNDYATAERLYRQILAADPDILAARVNLGLACYFQHKTRDAATELQKALRASPREFSALLFSGLAYIDLAEYDRAQAVLERAQGRSATATRVLGAGQPRHDAQRRSERCSPARAMLRTRP